MCRMLPEKNVADLGSKHVSTRVLGTLLEKLSEPVAQLGAADITHGGDKLMNCQSIAGKVRFAAP